MEFQEVMKQFDRMCKTNAGCLNCPLHEQGGVSDRCSIGAFVNDSKRIEREITAWAAEHPEPVYQTWAEWLAENVPGVDADSIYEGWHVLCDTQIPADIAQKLGIEPKGEA